LGQRERDRSRKKGESKKGERIFRSWEKHVGPESLGGGKYGGHWMHERERGRDISQDKKKGEVNRYIYKKERERIREIGKIFMNGKAKGGG